MKKMGIIYGSSTGTCESIAQTIAEKLGVTPAALSYHLKLLKDADLVMEYKNKNYVYYEINTTVFDELILWIEQFGGKKK